MFVFKGHGRSSRSWFPRTSGHLLLILFGREPLFTVHLCDVSSQLGTMVLMADGDHLNATTAPQMGLVALVALVLNLLATFIHLTKPATMQSCDVAMLAQMATSE
jgi:hypothetical protein